MKNHFARLIQPLLKPLLAIALVVMLVFSQGGDALAATRGGGRMGGGSFRSAPSRSYSAPRPAGGGYGYGGGYYGGGGGSFFLLPFLLGGGGGGLFTLLILGSIATFLFQSFRQASGGEDISLASPQVSVTKLQVGLLADARGLQADLDRIALKANTSTNAGLTQILQETTLSLLRHPEYWVYAGSQSKLAKLDSAEIEFNRLSLTERSKVSGETLSNTSGQLKQKESSAIAVSTPGDLDVQQNEFIVVTLIVGSQGKLDLPKITSAEDVRRALSQLGAVSSDRLLALEVLWTPQANGDVLTRDDMITDYPSLHMV
ncbi:MAG: DUF1517 domain-containing protein [Alkalinema sp. RU_4_3]|nr:DUF1517 domain-containing protein [Alkalinema sp. RU_4_3]